MEVTNLLGKYKLGREIGRGAQGIVLSVQRIGSPDKIYACKSVWHGDDADKEVKSMQVLRGCSGTVQLHEVIRESSCNHLIMELCHSTLKDMIVSLGALSQEMAATLFKELATAVGEVHKKDLLHCDLKCQNVFITAEGHVKVGDFGLSQACPRGCTIKTTPIGTLRYLSPEATKGMYSAASDVWALGLILYESLSSKMPFEGETNDGLLTKLQMGIDVAQNLDWSGLSCSARDFILAMLQVHPQERLTIPMIVEHPLIVNESKSGDERQKMLCLLKKNITVTYDETTSTTTSSSTCTCIQGITYESTSTTTSSSTCTSHIQGKARGVSQAPGEKPLLEALLRSACFILACVKAVLRFK